MMRTMLDTAMRLMQRGLVPSVSDVAEAAAVSRATAYRYFPSQAALIEATVSEALRPIIDWQSNSPDAEERVTELLAFALPLIEADEATHRAALLLALDQWRRRQAGMLGAEEPFVRGHRKALLADALKPLKRRLGRPAFDRAVQALSLVFGSEALVVLKDIWGLDGAAASRVVIWAARALVRAAAAGEPAGPKGRSTHPRRSSKDIGKKRRGLRAKPAGRSA
jgi:AcrR family transcriptional regulator